MNNPDKQRINELEEEVKQSQLEVDIYKKFTAIAKRELNIKIVKKSGAKPSVSLHNKNRNVQ